MDLWNWDEASPQEVLPGNRLSGPGRLRCVCVWQGKGVLGAGEPPLTLTGPNLLTAEGAELGFYFHELALQGNTLTEETSWKGVCGLGPLSAGEGERLSP